MYYRVKIDRDGVANSPHPANNINIKLMRTFAVPVVYLDILNLVIVRRKPGCMVYWYLNTLHSIPFTIDNILHTKYTINIYFAGARHPQHRAPGTLTTESLAPKLRLSVYKCVKLCTNVNLYIRPVPE